MSHSVGPRPTDTLRWCLPRNGMKWQAGHSITRRPRIDARVVAALGSVGVPMRKRDVQVELTSLVDEGTALARQVSCGLGRDVDRSEFLAELRRQHRLGPLLSLDHFEQIFSSIVLARYRYVSDRWEEELPDEDPANHCHLARAVDAFERAAWFWSTTEAFFEDDHTRAEDAARGDESDLEEGSDQDRAAGSSVAVAVSAPASAPAAARSALPRPAPTSSALAALAALSRARAAAAPAAPAVAAASVANPADPAYVSLAEGVEAMELDDDVAGEAGEAMELDG